MWLLLFIQLLSLPKPKKFKFTMNLETISHVRKYYLSATKPAKNIFSKLNPSENSKIDFNEEFQHLILKETVLHPLAVKYQNKNYARQFLKGFINLIEENKAAVCEKLYQLYTDLVSNPITEEDLSYRHYILNDEKFITLQESNSFIGENTTGLHTWEAGKQLAEWCVKNKNIFADTCILELGCGVGFTGLAIALSCNPSKYIFTDCNETVLKLLEKNIALNKESLQETILRVEKINWGGTIEFDQPVIDYILAADVIYDPNFHTVLCSTIKEIGPKLGTIMAVKERDPESRAKFEKCLCDYKLSYTNLQPSLDNLFLYPEEDVFFLYKII